MISIYRHNDKVYQIKRQIPINYFIPKNKNDVNLEIVKTWKEYLNCTNVLRTPSHFIFCDEVEDLKIIE